MSKSSNKEYSITVNLFIFLTLISIVVISRIIIVQIFKTNTFESVALIDDVKFNMQEDMTSVIEKVKNTMEESYGINIYYGSVLKDVLPQVNANVLYDENRILQMLKNINSELNKYPSGVISEIQSKGYNISIYLVDNFNNNNVALANRTSNGYFNIFLSESEELSKSVHHEFYHILEYYIKLQYDINMIYSSWNSYNPNEFIYTSDVKNIDNMYVYGLDNINELSFVSLYSKFSEDEDRAEVFSDMMIGSQRYYKNGRERNIVNKMDYITDTLDLVFLSVEEGAYWERYK